jgi:predicted metalloprotease
MKWRSARRSSNIEDRRGQPLAGGGMKLGLGGIAAVVVIGLLLGKNPMEMLGLVAEMQQGAPQGQMPAPGGAPPADDEGSQFVAAILGETEDVWTALFQGSGGNYAAPTLVPCSPPAAAPPRRSVPSIARATARSTSTWAFSTRWNGAWAAAAISPRPM